MKVMATLLTALLAVLLTASVPASVETCCPPQKLSASCCTGECHCHVTAPNTPQPAAPSPATLHAACDALVPVFANDFLAPPVIEVVSAIQIPAPTGASPPYLLTHAFLI